MDVIRTASLCKCYGRLPAVDHLEMHVPKGAIYGFIGRNGSGKSTTLKMLCGLAYPTSGEIRLFDKPVDDDLARRRVGALIEETGAYPTLSGRENLILKAVAMGLTDEKRRADEMLGLVGLGTAGGKKVKKYSMGMKRRLGIALALLGSPDLLLLDEPLNGLDPEGILQLRALLLRLNRENGVTIVVSSHILGELEKISTHYGILQNGRMAAELSAAELQKKCRDYLLVRVNGQEGARRAAVVLEQALGIREYEVLPEGELHILQQADPAAVTAALTGAGIAVQAVSLHRQELEDYFLDLMGGQDHA